MSEQLIIQGGTPLRGDVWVSGAKNSVLKLMAAALLTEETVELFNVPELSDVAVMGEMVRYLGRNVIHHPKHVIIEGGSLTSYRAPYELVSKMRASFIVLGALLGRFGEAKVSLPGGCSIGKRGVDLHVKGLQALGAEIEIAHGYVEARADRLVGDKIVLDIPSVGATENIMLAAVLAEGSTIISNAAQEPEIMDLAKFLNAMGADVNGAGTSEIVINGVAKDQLHGVHYHVVPDRIEAGTFLIAAAATGGHVRIHETIPSHLDALIAKLTDMGAEITIPEPNLIEIHMTQRLRGQDVVTQPYPGFPTDLQAPLMTALTTAEGVSIVSETIYENRFKQIGELQRMGADIHQKGDVAVVTGVDSLTGAEVQAHDLRAGAAMVVAGLMAQGTTRIGTLHHIDRGYELLVQKLTGLGAHIERVIDDRQVVEDAVIVP